MDDKAIRSALRDWISQSDPHAVIINELPLCRGIGRADIAAVNGSLNGFEIKSDRDTLARLPKQIETYQAIFDYCHLVVGARYLKKSKDVTPDNWGIIVVEIHNDLPVVRRVRKARQNDSVDTFSLVRLLWKPEVVRVLRRMGSSVSSQAPVRAMWSELAGESHRIVAGHVRESLKARAPIGSALPSSQYDDSFPTVSTAVVPQSQ